MRFIRHIVVISLLIRVRLWDIRLTMRPREDARSHRDRSASRKIWIAEEIEIQLSLSICPFLTLCKFLMLHQTSHMNVTLAWSWRIKLPRAFWAIQPKLRRLLMSMECNLHTVGTRLCINVDDLTNPLYRRKVVLRGPMYTLMLVSAPWGHPKRSSNRILQSCSTSSNWWRP